MTNGDLAIVMFGKAVILTAWQAYKDARESGLIDLKWQRLVLRFQHEWNHRRAKQPLRLTDQRPGRPG